MTIPQNLTRLKASVRSVLEKCGDPSRQVEIVLVSKTVEPERIQEAYHAGVADFGENRVQEFLRKKPLLPADIRWHLIGHLQTNKVKQVLGETVLIHSLDRVDLAREIERQARAKKIASVDCLIQVDSAGEITKFGFPPEEIQGFVAGLAADSPIRIRGLMTIGPLTEDREKIRKAFRTVKNLREELAKKFPDKGWNILSMGMSSDYEIALEEGATMIRIGSAVFGSRSA